MMKPSSPYGHEVAAIEVIEASKYGLRMILLLHANGTVSLRWLLNRIPTSVETIVRCARILEGLGIVSSIREEQGRKRRLYTLTRRGEEVATKAPSEWAPPNGTTKLIRNP